VPNRSILPLPRVSIRRPAVRWSAAAGFVWALAFFVAGHAAVRLLLWNSVEFDEAEQLVFVQSIRLGYSAQPPLYTWLLAGPVAVLGPGVAALAVVKFAVMIAVAVLLHRVTTRFVDDPRLAALAAMTPVLVPVFAWEAIRMMTHTMLVCAIFLATLLSLMRLRDRGTTLDYLRLGACFGLGVLAKYNFVLFGTALLLAAGSMPSFRRGLRDRRIGLTLLVAGAIVAPHAIWMIGHLGEIRDGVTGYSKVAHAGPFAGIANLAMAMLMGLAPPLVAIGLWFAPAFRHRMTPRPADDRLKLLPRFLAIATLLLLGTLVLGVRVFRPHWLGPMVLLAPVAVFARWNGIAVSRFRMAGYAATVAVAAVAVLGLRAATLVIDYRDGQYQTRDFLYAALSDRVGVRGEPIGEIVVTDPVVAGYARLHWPTRPVHCLRYPSHAIGTGHGARLIIWDATGGDEMPSQLRSEIDPSRPANFITVPRRRFDSATKRLGYHIVAEPTVAFATPARGGVPQE
jgi:lipopolysaccharide core galacturonosyltransferase RgtB